MRKNSGALVFGMTDGAVLVLGLFLGEVVSRQSASALWHAALGGGLAELGGMSLGAYWADPAKDKKSAALNGIGCAAATVIAGMPFAFLREAIAVVASSAIILAIGVLICILREETGWLSAARTFGLLAIAGLLSGASGLI